MIDRYTRPQMGQIWTSENKFASFLKVEKAVSQIQAEMGIIPKEAFLAIQKKAKFNIHKINEIEVKTKHDVIAFVTNVSESVGEYGKFVHYGLTSSDVLDTALSLLIRDSNLEFKKTTDKLIKVFERLIKDHKNTLCVGRTHGIHAEPITFGWKLASFYTELKRNLKRYNQAFVKTQKINLSGPVGTYSFLKPDIEQKVGELLKLKSECVSTQVLPRDIYADLIYSLALVASGFERLSVELRHLQRTEVDEVEEGFSKGQKGSSAMPHKKNPISGENLTGLSRLLRSYVQPSLENIILWHERDISHSSVERVILGDAFILIDYMTSRITELLDNLIVKKENMIKNLNITRGKIYSSHVLLKLIDKGMSRSDAYAYVQALSMKLKSDETLKDKLLLDRKLSKTELDLIFNGKNLIKNLEGLYKRVFDYTGE